MRVENNEFCPFLFEVGNLMGLSLPSSITQGIHADESGPRSALLITSTEWRGRPAIVQEVQSATGGEVPRRRVKRITGVYIRSSEGRSRGGGSGMVRYWANR